jgi:SAM-dependent methyltransferase
MKITEKLSAVLGLPAAYRLFTRMVGGDVWRVYLDEYVKPVAGEKILDIGCGPADILSYMGDVNYTGFDISPEYIAAAQKRFGDRGRFFCSDVGLATIEREQGTFNLVMATGVLHHLDDEVAGKLFQLARLALRRDGRLVTYDGCYVPDQSRVARWLLSQDRGNFVRPREEYLRLASACFSKIEAYRRDDLLRIPYTHLIMRCSDGIPSNAH